MTETFSGRAEWNFWRGSPELLAQVARVAMRCATTDDLSEPECKITVEVAGDLEIFSSPNEFVLNVTREALRGFRRIEINAVGQALQIEVSLSWRRPWWQPGVRQDAEVALAVRGTGQAAVEDALGRVRAAIKRGATEGELTQGAVMFAILALTVAALVAATISTLYLLGQSQEMITWASIAVGVLGIAIGLLWGSWEYPSLEVASYGQTNLWRAVKFAGPLVGSLILAGATKALFG